MTATGYECSIQVEESHDGVGYCRLCDLLFSLEDAKDVAHHDKLHARFAQAAAAIGAPMTAVERGAAETVAGQALSRLGATLAERLMAAELLLRASYHKHVRRAVNSGRGRAVCAEREFIAASDVEAAFPADVAQRLREKFGRTGAKS